MDILDELGRYPLKWHDAYRPARVLHAAAGHRLEFWDDYPRKVVDFDEAVERGIYCRARLEYPRKASLRGTYRGFSCSELAKLSFFRTSAPDTFEERYGAEASRAIDDYRADRTRIDEEYNRAWKAAQADFERQHQLPTPPFGYGWVNCRGGVMTPNFRSWQLWGRHMGIPPRGQ